MIEFIEYIVKNVVREPEAVQVSENEDEKGKVILVQVADSDKPLIIGKGGRNIKAIRELAFAKTKRDDLEKAYIKIEE